MSRLLASSLPSRPQTPIFALAVGRHSLKLREKNLVKDQKDPNTGKSVYVALFLSYIRQYLVDEYEQLRLLPDLSDLIHIRFIRLITPGHEESPYRQMFFVYPHSSNQIIQRLDTRLSLNSLSMRQGGLIYVVNPGPMPAPEDPNYQPIMQIGLLQRCTTTPLTPLFVRDAIVESARVAKQPAQGGIPTPSSSSSNRFTKTNNRPSRPMDDGNESDDPIALNSVPSNLELESESFALIAAKFIIRNDEDRDLFDQDASRRYRFWRYVAEWTPADFESPISKTNATHELDVDSRLIRVNSNTSREIFFVKPKGDKWPSPRAKDATMRLKKRFIEKRDLLEKAGLVLWCRPGPVLPGNSYSPPERIMALIRKQSAVRLPELLPKKVVSQGKTVQSAPVATNRPSQPGSASNPSLSANRPPAVILPLPSPAGLKSTGKNSVNPRQSLPNSLRRTQPPLPSVKKRPTDEKGATIISSEESTGPMEPIEISDDESEEEPARAKPPMEIIDLTTPPLSTIDLPESSNPADAVISAKSTMQGRAASPSASPVVRNYSAPPSNIDEIDQMDLDSPPTAVSVVLPIQPPSQTAQRPLPSDDVFDTEMGAGSAPESLADVSFAPSPVQITLGSPFDSPPSSPASSKATKEVSRLHRPAFSSTRDDTASGSPIKLNFREEEEPDEGVALKELQDVLTLAELEESKVDDLKSRAESPTSASEVATDAEKYGDIVDKDPTAGCTEWAKRMAADMKPSWARRYLAKARKYHRDELDSSFTDYLRSRPIEYQRATYNRDIFESWILKSTRDDPISPPIGIKNTVDDEPCPEWEFFYTNKMIRGDGVPKPLPVEAKAGCSCVGGCRSDVSKCACAARQNKYTADIREDIQGFLYNDRGELQELQLPVFECNDACSCAEYCNNRIAQRGRQYAIDIRKTENRGWGIFAAENIPAGAFLGLYSGEVLLSAEADVRAKDLYDRYNRTYLFNIDCYYIKHEARSKGKKDSTKYAIDAMHVGCFTRFLNHACYPNTSIVPCIFGEADFEIPYLAFYSRIPIAKDEEITFSYKGYDMTAEEEASARKRADAKKLFKKVTRKPDASRGKAKIFAQCQCGSWNCNGSLFKTSSAEDTPEEDSELDGLPSDESDF